MPQFCSYANEAGMAVLIQASSFDPEADNSHLPLYFQSSSLTIEADMVVLIRKVEELQRKIVNYYFDYMASRAALIKTEEIVNKRKKIFSAAQNKSKEQILMADSFYREALQMQNKAKADFLSKRSALEQIVGLDTMADFEEILAQRKN